MYEKETIMPTIKLSKQQWEFIGKKTGWIKTAQSSQTYRDKNNSGRTMDLSGPDSFDQNFIFDAIIRDEFGDVESVFSGTLAEIYLEAKVRKFAMPESMKELQTAKSIKQMKTANSQDIIQKLQAKSPLLYKIISRMPGFNSALDIVDNIVNNKVSPENAGINQDIIDQAEQIIQDKVKTASSMPNVFDNTIIIKEAFALDARVIAAIVIIILGIALGKSMLSDIKDIKAIPSQVEQLQK